LSLSFLVFLMVAAVPLVACTLLVRADRERVAWTLTLVLALGALALVLSLRLGGITGEPALVPILLLQVAVFPAAVGAALGSVLGHLLAGR